MAPLLSPTKCIGTQSLLYAASCCQVAGDGTYRARKYHGLWLHLVVNDAGTLKGLYTMNCLLTHTPARQLVALDMDLSEQPTSSPVTSIQYLQRGMFTPSWSVPCCFSNIPQVLCGTAFLARGQVWVSGKQVMLFICFSEKWGKKSLCYLWCQGFPAFG